MQLRRTDLPGAVRKAQAVEVQAQQVVDRGGELFIAGRPQVGPADDGMNAGRPEFFAKIFDRIDQTGMRTAEQDNQPTA